jgi:6-phosphogluconolactonase
LDASTGAVQLLDVGDTGPLKSPLFVETDREARVLYVADYVNEVDGTVGGAIAALAIEPGTGKLKFLNRVPCGGSVPCYVSVSPDRKYVLAANYGDGTVSMLPLNPDGSLQPPSDAAQHKRPQDKKANAHCIVYDTNRRFALSADLGVDRIFAYRPDGTAMKLNQQPNPVQTAAKAGPRHLSFHPSGKVLYCQTEYDNTVIAMTYDATTGAAKIIQTESSLPAGFSEKNYGADIQVHPSGKFLYSTNRGHNSIAVFGIDQSSGRISCVGHEPTQGKFPRDIDIDPSGGFLIVGNEHSSSLVVFRIDPETGRLSAAGQPTAVANPAAIKIVAQR